MAVSILAAVCTKEECLLRVRPALCVASSRAVRRVVRLLRSVLASGGDGEDELHVGYEAALWELLVLCFLRCDDLEMGALPEVCNAGCASARMCSCQHNMARNIHVAWLTVAWCLCSHFALAISSLLDRVGLLP
jgi:hypothetical protein